MAETKTCELWREWRLQHEAAWKAIEAAAAQEFQQGTRVRWVHSFKPGSREPIYREGVVQSRYGSGLNVQMKAGGPLHRVDAYLADILAPGVALPQGTQQENGNG